MLETVLRKIEEDNRRKIQWIVGPATGRLLYGLIRVANPLTVLEIGTSVGYSALWIASALEKNQRGKLWTVESHANRFEQAQKNFREAQLEHRIIGIRGHAPEIFSDYLEIPSIIDFVFFDATKQEHQNYFDAVFPRMVSGGVMVVDNTLSHRFGPMKKFIETMHKHPGLKVVEIGVGSGLLLARVL